MNLLLIGGLSCGLLSVLTYAVYALDKTAARRGHRRVSEHTLHLLALLGGWPGALLAQQRLRHKTRKTGFQFMYWLTVLIHLSVWVMLALYLGQRLP